MASRLLLGLAQGVMIGPADRSMGDYKYRHGMSSRRQHLVSLQRPDIDLTIALVGIVTIFIKSIDNALNCFIISILIYAFVYFDISIQREHSL
jgi:hypothetical protein